MAKIRALEPPNIANERTKMQKIILSICFFMLFIHAKSCDFGDKAQKDCELDVANPPVFLHKFIDKNGRVNLAHKACFYDDKVQIYEDEYDVINCSMTEGDDGSLTEGVILGNAAENKLLSAKNIELKSDKILLRVAGDLVLDSGVRLNPSGKKFIVEMIEGSNGKANITLQRGAKLDATMIIMPDGENANITLNTYFGGIYEREFISQINDKSAAKRANMETAIATENIYSLKTDGENIVSFNGKLTCGPELNPLELSDKNYVLKRLFIPTNTDFASPPSAKNAVCVLEGGECFSGLLSHGNVNIDDKIYKIATAKLQIPPKYGVFVEGGKVLNRDGDSLIAKLPDAKISGQNGGKCGVPSTLAFSKEKISEYEKIAANATKDSALQDSPKDSPDSSLGEANLAANLDLAATAAEVEKEAAKTEAEKTLANESAKNESAANLAAAAKNEVAESSPPESSPQKPVLSQNAAQKRLRITDDFLLVEEGAFLAANRLCGSDLECLNGALAEADKAVSDKISSKNAAHALYIVNLTGAKLPLKCEIRDYYGKNIDASREISGLSSAVELRFPHSSTATSLFCKSANTAKSTNKIVVNPAKIALKPDFLSTKAVALKAGVVEVGFADSVALNLEGEVDRGFEGALVSKNLTFEKEGKCASENDVKAAVFAPTPMKIRFKNGYATKEKSKFMANTIASGVLTMEFALENEAGNAAANLGESAAKNAAQNGAQSPAPNLKIAQNLSIIPANFMIKTSLIAPHKIAYYGQIEERNTFKFNPQLGVEISALNNQNEVLDLSKSCKQGAIELTLENDFLLEFKKSISDRLNARLNFYLDEFSDKSATRSVYLGIAKLRDGYNNTRKIQPNDLLEPREIKLTDLKFNARFKNGRVAKDYDDLVVYDRLENNLVEGGAGGAKGAKNGTAPMSMMIARGKIQVKENIATEKGNGAILQYEIYCKTCDRAALARYLDVRDLEMDEENWFINTKHPSDFYLSDAFIKTPLKVQNSNLAFEGRQEIIFNGTKTGDFDVKINQQGFAPYLSYDRDYKNFYANGGFKVSITEIRANLAPEKTLGKATENAAPKTIDESIQKIKEKALESSSAPSVKTPTASIKPKPNATAPTQKAAPKKAPKGTKNPPKKGGIELDIED